MRYRPVNETTARLPAVPSSLIVQTKRLLLVIWSRELTLPVQLQIYQTAIENDKVSPTVRPMPSRPTSAMQSVGWRRAPATAGFILSDSVPIHIRRH